MRSSPGLTLVLGLWLGSTVAVLGLVGSSFGSFEQAMEANPELRERIENEAKDRRMTTVWVYAGELNRSTFYVWNRVQLGLAAASLIIALLRLPRAAVVGALMAAGAIVLALTFWGEPRITEIGRTLDFRPRSDPDLAGAFARFDRLHDLYLGLESLKTLLVLAASLLALRWRPEG